MNRVNKLWVLSFWIDYSLRDCFKPPRKQTLHLLHAHTHQLEQSTLQPKCQHRPTITAFFRQLFLIQKWLLKLEQFCTIRAFRRNCLLMAHGVMNKEEISGNFVFAHMFFHVASSQRFLSVPLSASKLPVQNWLQYPIQTWWKDPQMRCLHQRIKLRISNSNTL